MGAAQDFYPDGVAELRSLWMAGCAAGIHLNGAMLLRDWKGWKELIDATAEVSRSHPEVHLALIGCRDQSEAATVMEHARARGIGDQVTAVEYRTDMPSVLAACGLVVDASWAGTGITGTIREAMALGRPVVASAAGGNPELVVDGEPAVPAPLQAVTA